MNTPIHKYTPYGESIKLFNTKHSEVLLNGPAL